MLNLLIVMETGLIYFLLVGQIQAVLKQNAAVSSPVLRCGELWQNAGLCVVKALPTVYTLHEIM